MHPHTHTNTHPRRQTNVLTAACLSLPHARYLHQFWWPPDDGVHCRPHASSPKLPCDRSAAANLSKGREKGSSDDNKAWPIFHENEVLWHSLQWPGSRRGGGEGGGGLSCQRNGCKALIMWSFFFFFFFIRDSFYKGVTGGWGSLRPPLSIRAERQWEEVNRKRKSWTSHQTHQKGSIHFPHSEMTELPKKFQQTLIFSKTYFGGF